MSTPRGGPAMLLLLAVLTLAVLVAATSVGATSVGLRDLLAIVSGGGDPSGRALLIDVRLARVLLAAVVGAALASAGAAYQAVLRNPLADPFILGISGGAALGATLYVAVSPASAVGSPLGRPVAAFAGAAATLVVLFGLARFRGRTATTALLLTGVVLNAFDSAIIQFLVTAGDPARFQGTLAYLMGAMSSPAWGALASVALLTALGLVVLATHAHTLNLLSLGAEEAGQLGVAVERSTWVAVLAASLITAAAVAFTGIVGFIGLIVPHAMRAAFGPDHRVLLPACALAGAATVAAADAAARTLLAPVELPVGVITALVGGPFFLVLLLRRLRAA